MLILTKIIVVLDPPLDLDIECVNRVLHILLFHKYVVLTF